MAKNVKGNGSIYKRKDGYWEGKVTVGTDPMTGKLIRKSVYGKTQQEVRKKINELTTTVDNGTYTEPVKLTVNQWLDVWTAEYLDGVKPNTQDRYKMICRRHINPTIGAVKLISLSAHTVQTLINGLGREKGLAPKTVRNIHGCLHKALQTAVRIGYLKNNPSDACILPRLRNHEIKPLDEVSTGVFIQAIKGNRFENLYFMALFTGVRQGEAIGLTWDRVDFEKGIITVDRQLQRNRVKGIFELSSTKNGKSRVITPPERVMAVLRDQKRAQAVLRLAAGELWQDNGYVFTDEIGGHVSPTTVYKHFKRIVAEIGKPDRRFHDLRHTYATMALANGVGVKDVQETLGHYSAAFTLDKYGHVTENMKRDNAAKIDRFIDTLTT